MRRLIPIIIAVALFALPWLPATSDAAKSCPAMQKELGDLRREYHSYAKGDGGNRQESVKFDKLVEILDRIIDLTRQMRETNCQIRPRLEDIRRKK